MKKLTNEEQELYYIVNGSGGSFMTSLFNAIMKADMMNTIKLGMVYPEFVEVVKKYQNESGYWESVEDAMNPQTQKESK